jgi:hypothetical protein
MITEQAEQARRNALMTTLRRLDRLPKMRMAVADFLALPEYSCSVPGFHENWLRPDRFWRRLDGAHDHGFLRSGGRPVWMIGCYRDVDHAGEPAGPGKFFSLWFKPVLVIPAALGRVRPGPQIGTDEAVRMAHA